MTNIVTLNECLSSGGGQFIAIHFFTYPLRVYEKEAPHKEEPLPTQED
jgi:hypothetical protein